jgi:small subunit ribosomal protein S1
LEEGLEGLIHISELANGNFMHPRMVVQEGNKVTARVLDIDSANRRLALSLRRARSAGRQGAAIGDRELQPQEPGHIERSSYESSGEL